MFYKMSINKEGNNFLYPVPNIEEIRGAKYKKNMSECVCEYPYEISGNGITEITETQYNQYPKCRINIDKVQIKADGEDTVAITVTLPEAEINETIKLYINGKLIKFKTSSTIQSVFNYTSTQIGIIEIQAESDNWRMSDKKLLEVY